MPSKGRWHTQYWLPNRPNPDTLLICSNILLHGKFVFSTKQAKIVIRDKTCLSKIFGDADFNCHNVQCVKLQELTNAVNENGALLVYLTCLLARCDLHLLATVEGTLYLAVSTLLPFVKAFCLLNEFGT